MMFLFKPKSLLILAGFFFAYYFYNLPTTEQDQMAATAVKNGAEITKKGVKVGKDVGMKLASKVSNFVHTHTPDKALEKLEESVQNVGADEITEKMEKKLKNAKAVSEKWNEFRERVLEESGLTEADLNKVSDLSEYFQEEVEGLFEAMNSADASGESVSKLIDEFESDVIDRFDSGFNKIVGNERLQKIETRREEFSKWVSENYPNFTNQVKNLSWY